MNLSKLTILYTYIGYPSWITTLLWQRGLCNLMKSWALPGRVTQDGQVIVKSSDKTLVHWRSKWQQTPVILPKQHYGLHEKAKVWNQKMSSPGQFSSVQSSRSVVSDSLQPHESQPARPPCPSPTPGVHSNSCPLSRWCHPAISSSVVPFSSCPQSLPASESFPVSQLFTWGGQVRRCLIY